MVPILDRSVRIFADTLAVGALVLIQIADMNPTLGAVVPSSETVRYAIDPARSRASFEMSATLHTVRGVSNRVTGEIGRPAAVGPREFPVTGRIVIEAASLDTGNASRDKKMRAESLDVAHHPEIVFVPRRAAGDAVTFTPGSPLKLMLEGDLTIRGFTRAVSLDVEGKATEGGFVADGRARISFLDYGVPDPSNFLLRVKPDLVITVHVEAAAILPAP